MSFLDPEYFSSGIYTDPNTNRVVLSNQKCNSVLTLPCGFKNQFRIVNIETTDSPCIIKWCKLQQAIFSIAGSDINTSDATRTLSLTAGELAAARALAKTILA
jgi:hypothetical protein